MIPVAGCDPGAKGALCWVRDSARIERLRFNGRSIYEMRSELLGRTNTVKCYFEQQGYRSSDSKKVASMMQFMRNTGNIEGALCIMGYELIYITDWIYEFGLGGIHDYDELKKAAHAYAKSLLNDKTITKDEADAILIAIYGWRKENGVLTHGRKEGFISRTGTGVLFTKRSSD